MLSKEERERNRYLSTNLIWEDAKEYHMTRKHYNIWSDDEKKIFKDKFVQYPKQFSVIANALPKKVFSLYIYLCYV